MKNSCVCQVTRLPSYLILISYHYFKVLSEIQQERYTEIVAIDGRLKRVPKKNARGESILKPEDVQVGLNFNVISKEITDTETIIHELRIRENNILKILKKRAKCKNINS